MKIRLAFLSSPPITTHHRTSVNCNSQITWIHSVDSMFSKKTCRKSRSFEYGKPGRLNNIWHVWLFQPTSREMEVKVLWPLIAESVGISREDWDEASSRLNFISLEALNLYEPPECRMSSHDHWIIRPTWRNKPLQNMWATKNTRPYFPLYWLVNRDPYNGLL